MAPLTESDVEAAAMVWLEAIGWRVARGPDIAPDVPVAGRIVPGRMESEDITLLPVEALREVLVNAVAHADYSMTGMRIRVAIYADRLEVENPGMLPFGMTLDDLKAGISRIRNRVIVRVLRELGLVEEWGSGYRRVMQACQAEGYPPPEWQELGPALRVIFRPHAEATEPSDARSRISGDETVNEPENETVSETVSEAVSEAINEAVNARQRWFLEQLTAGRHSRWVDMVEHWKISRATAKRDISDLKTRNLIEFTGPPKTGFYRLKIQPSA